MANINISDLRPAGADLFLDSESYLNDLTEGEMLVTGGQQSDVHLHSHVKTCFDTLVLEGRNEEVSKFFQVAESALGHY